jgi:hypothetical protein
MWSEYTCSPESVVLITSVKALGKSIVGGLIRGTQQPIRYTEPNVPRPLALGWNSPIWYKPNAFSYEKEYRVLLNLGDTESIAIGGYATDEERKQNECRMLQVRLPVLVQEIRTHPNATITFLDKVRHLVSKSIPHIRPDRIGPSKLPSSVKDTASRSR